MFQARFLRSIGVDTSKWSIIETTPTLPGGSFRPQTRGLGSSFLERWQPVTSGGPITVPYAIQSVFASDADNVIEEAVAALESDLHCFDMPLVSDPSTTTYENGLMFILHQDACFAALGLAPGFVTNDQGATQITQFGVPATWQVVNLNQACSHSIGVVQHEVLHSLGVFHEQSRPDRKNYIDVWPERSTKPGKRDKYKKVSYLRSMGHYCFQSMVLYGFCL